MARLKVVPFPFVPPSRFVEDGTRHQHESGKHNHERGGREFTRAINSQTNYGFIAAEANCAAAESKNPYTLNCGKKYQGILPAQPVSWSING